MARLMAEVEVVKLVCAAACHRLPVMHIYRFFIEQTRLTDRTSPVLPGREGSFDGICVVPELSPPTCGLN